MQMGTAYFRFYEELNDFLPQKMRQTAFPYSFTGNPSVKDAIEAIGVPHSEVDLILINSEPAVFEQKLNDADSVSVYPVFESIEIAKAVRLREKPLRNTRFIADVHLGKLTRYLRLCGFDTYFMTDLDDREIINIALADNRIILTRDKGLLKNRDVTHGYWVRSVDPRIQLEEILRRLDLRRSVNLFTRCMECNGILQDVQKAEILGLLPPKTRQYFRKFKRCTGCRRIYWNGSHYASMKKEISMLLHKR